jgi:CheY-like chemotaxis protein
MSLPATVLLAEDDPDLRDVMELLLVRAGYFVVATGDGLRAVELAAEHEPAVAVVDLLLPGQSGFQVTSALKARYGDRVRVLVVSGSASRAHEDYALASGAERFLAKPVPASLLVEAVAALCPPPQNAADSGIRRAVRIGS